MTPLFGWYATFKNNANITWAQSECMWSSINPGRVISDHSFDLLLITSNIYSTNGTETSQLSPNMLYHVNDESECLPCETFSDLDPSVPLFTPNISNYASQNNNKIKIIFLGETEKRLPTLNPLGKPFYPCLDLSKETKNDFAQHDNIYHLGSSLNPCAKRFSPRVEFEPLGNPSKCLLIDCPMNQRFEMLGERHVPNATRYSTNVLNPNAIPYIPNCFPKDDRCLTHILIIISVLIIYLLILLFDDMSIRRVNIKDKLKEIKLANHEKIIIGHLNINSIGYKIEFLKERIGNNINILLVSETKLNETFPTSEFLMDEFQVPVRLDRKGNGGGLLLFYRDHIPCKKIKFDFNPEIETIVVEINMKKRKWVLIGSYNPHKDKIKDHLDSIGKLLNELSIKYDNFILIGDFNSEMHEEPMNI